MMRCSSVELRQSGSLPEQAPQLSRQNVGKSGGTQCYSSGTVFYTVSYTVQSMGIHCISCCDFSISQNNLLILVWSRIVNLFIV